jgi:tRNA threonylcarbamoyladenosine biosynthesis protein TsaE
LVLGLARGLGIDEEAVSSPTFVLANEYFSPAAGLSLHHVDFYRLETVEELETMGFYELMAPDALLAVEWGARFSRELPADRVELVIETIPESAPEARILRARGKGAQSKDLLKEWRGLLAEAEISVAEESVSDARA